MVQPWTTSHPTASGQSAALPGGPRSTPSTIISTTAPTRTHNDRKMLLLLLLLWSPVTSADTDGSGAGAGEPECPCIEGPVPTEGCFNIRVPLRGKLLSNFTIPGTCFPPGYGSRCAVWDHELPPYCQLQPFRGAQHTPRVPRVMQLITAIASSAAKCGPVHSMRRSLASDNFASSMAVVGAV